MTPRKILFHKNVPQPLKLLNDNPNNVLKVSIIQVIAHFIMVSFSYKSVQNGLTEVAKWIKTNRTEKSF